MIHHHHPGQKDVDLLYALNGAIINVRLYPQESDLVKNAVGRICRAMGEALEEEGALEYAETEAKLLVQGDVLPEKIQKNPRVRGFVSLMVDMGIRSITFKKGIDEKELTHFLRLMAKPSEEVHESGGLPALIEEQGLAYIHVDEKIYSGRNITETGGNGTGGEASPPGDSKQASIKKALKRIGNADYEAFVNAAAKESLPQVFMQMAAKGKHSVTDMLLKSMAEAIVDDDPEIRKSVAAILSALDEKLESAGHTDLRIALSEIINQWVVFETEGSPEYEAAGTRMANLARQLISDGKTEKADEIIETYKRIASGDIEKNDAIKAEAEKVLQQISGKEVIDSLLQGFKKTGHNGQESIMQNLVTLGAKNIDPLLDRLGDSRDMSERNRMLQTITQIGPPAVPAIMQRLEQENPWYYVRNLVLLLGRLGNESHLEALERCLVFPDHRVQRETIKSIHAIGGADAGRMLLDHFERIDESLQAQTISVIGALRYEPAIPWLIDRLSAKMLTKKKIYREEILEKTCEALGHMKAEAAVSALDEIIRKKGVFGKKNPENVRSAAARALAEIKRR